MISSNDLQKDPFFSALSSVHAGRGFMGRGYHDERILPVSNSRGAYANFRGNNAFRGRGRWNEWYVQRWHQANCWDSRMRYVNNHRNMEGSWNPVMYRSCDRNMEASKEQGRLGKRRLDNVPFLHRGGVYSSHRRDHHNSRVEESATERDRGKSVKKSRIQHKAGRGGGSLGVNGRGRGEDFSEGHKRDGISRSHCDRGNRQPEEIKSDNSHHSHRNYSSFGTSNSGNQSSRKSDSYAETLPLLYVKGITTSHCASPSRVEQTDSLDSKDARTSDTQSHIPCIPTSCGSSKKEKKCAPLSDKYRFPCTLSMLGNPSQSEHEKEIQNSVKDQHDLSLNSFVPGNRKRQRSSAVRDYPEGCARISKFSPSVLASHSQSIIPFCAATSKPSDFSDGEGARDKNSEDCVICNDVEDPRFSSSELIQSSQAIVPLGAVMSKPSDFSDAEGAKDRNDEDRVISNDPEQSKFSPYELAPSFQSIVPFGAVRPKMSNFSEADGLKDRNYEDCVICNNSEANRRNSTQLISIEPSKYHASKKAMQKRFFEDTENIQEVRMRVSEKYIIDFNKKFQSISQPKQELMDISVEHSMPSIEMLEGGKMSNNRTALQGFIVHSGSLNSSLSCDRPHPLSTFDSRLQNIQQENVSRVSMCYSKIARRQAEGIKLGMLHTDRKWLDAEFPDSSDRYADDPKQPEVQRAITVRDDKEFIKTAQNVMHETNISGSDELRVSRPRAHTNHRNAATINGLSHNDGISARTMVKRTLHEFESLRRKYLKSKDPSRRPDLDAAAILKQKGKCQNSGEKIIGDVPGVEVGDQFSYRIEMLIIGLHRQVQGGIDYIPGNKRKNGLPIATSIVASGGYEDDIDNGDKLIYTGQGGNNYKGGRCQERDQKLVRGNLAMKNSMTEKKPVRVIRGIPDPASPSSKLYTYDGLYDVVDCRYESGIAGYSVYHFTLIRRPGQLQLGSSIVKFVGNLKKKGLTRPNLLLEDISQGQEKFPVCVVNEVDGEPAPENFTYIRCIKYPMWFLPLSSQGCDCVGGCFDENKCSCARKNGGELPYNEMGYIIRDKQMIYECGKSCNCPSSCPNRVSQNGLRYQLEVFKTKNRGWGVRSVNSIQPGGFVCEYIGELLSDAEAEQRIENDEYLFELGNSSKEDSEGTQIVGANVSNASAVISTKEDIGYTIDAKLMGNVGRFINHSCSPNLFAQNVLYDYDDPRFPHVMFFAMENIPPMRELTYDYNYTLNEVRDVNGNVKMKACHCGASDCKGRLY